MAAQRPSASGWITPTRTSRRFCGGPYELPTMRSGGLASVLPTILKLSVEHLHEIRLNPAPIYVILQVIESIGSTGPPTDELGCITSSGSMVDLHGTA